MTSASVLAQQHQQPSQQEVDRMAEYWPALHPLLLLYLEEAERPVKAVEYMTVHGHVANIAQNNSGGSAGAVEPVGDGIDERTMELLTRLRALTAQFLGKRLHDLQAADDESFLAIYRRFWANFSLSAKRIDRMLAPVNKITQKGNGAIDEQALSHGSVTEHSVHARGIHHSFMSYWIELVLTPLQDRLLRLMLRQVTRDRDGGEVDISLLSAIVASFIDLKLYAKFKEPFIRETGDYYGRESTAFLSGHSVTEYMLLVHRRLGEEQKRILQYLHSIMEKELMQHVQTVLIYNQRHKVMEVLDSLFQKDQDDDLQRMYEMFLLLDDLPRTQSDGNEALQAMRTGLERHICSVGMAAIDKVLAGVAPSAADADEDESSKRAKGASLSAAVATVDPKAYVTALLTVYQKYTGLVQNSFAGDASFSASLDRACREIVNRNKACHTTGKSPELLARFCDSILRKNAKNPEENELEETLTNVMLIFKYVEDRDVFQKFYTKLLAKRLVNQSSSSDDAESSMISKLKEACGYEYTSKLQRMFQDVGLSKELNSEFAALAKGYDLTGEFSILVCGTANWPLTNPTSNVQLPEELEKTYGKFAQFYGQKHSGRKLQRLLQLSRGVLKAHLNKDSKVPYTLNVSTYQMAVLLQFNSDDARTILELHEATALDEDELIRCLTIFCKAAILIPSEKTFKPDTSFTINSNFKSKKMLINLNQPTKSEQKQESEEVNKTVQDDRRMLIQAAIVRIMKARKQLEYANLMSEVIDQLKSRFTPKVPDIKKSIETLIEKEYLERVEGSRNTFAYIA